MANLSIANHHSHQHESKYRVFWHQGIRVRQKKSTKIIFIAFPIMIARSRSNVKEVIRARPARPTSVHGITFRPDSPLPPN